MIGKTVRFYQIAVATQTMTSYDVEYAGPFSATVLSHCTATNTCSLLVTMPRRTVTKDYVQYGDENKPEYYWLYEPKTRFQLIAEKINS